MLLLTFISWRAAGVLKAVVGVMFVLVLTIETFADVTAGRDGVINERSLLANR